jgi:sec-independent protein translocase protein TatA
MGLSFTHLLVLALVGVLLFGRGRISDLMGDVAKGIKSFKKGLADDDTDAVPPVTAPQKKIVSEAEMTDVTPVATKNETKS